VWIARDQLLAGAGLADERAVRAAEVLHEKLIALAADDEMVSADRRVIDHHVVVGRFADLERRAERVRLAGAVGVHEHQVKFL
jgi:hypothetical protein